jgi:hypothetical protein
MARVPPLSSIASARLTNVSDRSEIVASQLWEANPCVVVAFRRSGCGAALGLTPSSSAIGCAACNVLHSSTVSGMTGGSWSEMRRASEVLCREEAERIWQIKHELDALGTTPLFKPFQAELIAPGSMYQSWVPSDTTQHTAIRFQQLEHLSPWFRG